MKNPTLTKCMLLGVFVFGLTIFSQAQDRPSRLKETSTTSTTVSKATSAQTRISDADRKEIVSLFKGVDPSKYRIQFYNGESKAPLKYGKLNYRMADLQQVKRLKDPVGAVGWIVFVVEGDDVIYVLAVGSSKGDIKSVLGARKAARLESIMAKYK